MILCQSHPANFGDKEHNNGYKEIEDSNEPAPWQGLLSVLSVSGLGVSNLENKLILRELLPTVLPKAQRATPKKV